MGNQVVVGLDTQNDEVGVFFRTDGQLSDKFVRANNLYRKDPETGKPGGGFFDANRRVRCQKFRGEKSDGFWCPLSFFEFTKYDVSKLGPGDEFDELNGVPICNKYVTKATRQARQRRINFRRETKCFPMHVDTRQFRDYSDSIQHGNLIVITEKVHGTSHRFGYVLDKVEQKWWERLLRRPPKREYTYMSGSRRVILRGQKEDSFYTDESFRDKACEPFVDNLHKGEVVFFEIVGWAGETEHIMQPQNTDKLKDVKKQYGPQMVYKYGCIPGQFRALVYRIVMANEDGVLTEYPWDKVKARCWELGVEHVPEMRPQFVLSDEDMQSIVETAVEGPSLLDGSHIREGVVIRIDNGHETRFLKHKSFTFGLLEGYLKDDANFVDREEAA